MTKNELNAAKEKLKILKKEYKGDVFFELEINNKKRQLVYPDFLFYVVDKWIGEQKELKTILKGAML